MTTTSGITASVLDDIGRKIAADSILFASRLVSAPAAGDAAGYSDLFKTACGENVDGESHYLFAIEYIFEGYLLHYGSSRLLASSDIRHAGGNDRLATVNDQRPAQAPELPSEPEEFSLLAGDYMYAQGLNHLAALDDLFHIKAMAKLIELCSYIHCEGFESRLVLELWTVVTLCLASRAGAGASRSESCRLAFDHYIEEAWGGNMEEASLLEIKQEMLASLPPGKRVDAMAVQERIHANFAGRGRHDGDR